MAGAPESFDVVILGAGAAGMMCAIEAAKRGRRTLVIDHASSPGEKIRISGGGRCNFTNLGAAPQNFLSANPGFAISALRRYRPADFIKLVDSHDIAWHEKTLDPVPFDEIERDEQGRRLKSGARSDRKTAHTFADRATGQLFCDGKATQIIDMLLAEMDRHGAVLRLETAATDIEKTGDGFALKLNGAPVTCASLVVATGGKSIPKMGATGFGYEVARQFGVPLVATRPALVPLTFEIGLLERLKPLAGVAVDARVGHGKTRFSEAMLFTHRGLSGPAILQISSYWREGDEIVIDMAPGVDLLTVFKEARRANGRQAVHNILANHVPRSLARFITEAEGVPGNIADTPDRILLRIVQAVREWRVKPVGSEGYRTAEVTLGGVDTQALDSRTMAAKAVRGLFFIGEVVDVTGWLGGYNFQWAWASGWCAGQAA